MLDRAFSMFKKNQSMADTDLKPILREYLQNALDEDLEQHHRTRFGRPVYASSLDEYEDPIDADLSILASHLSEARERLARREVREVESIVSDLIEDNGLDESLIVPLALGVMQAHVQLVETSIERVLKGAAGEIELKPPAANAAQQSSPETGPPLSDILPEFIEFATKQWEWRGQTLAQNRTTYRMFIDCCGDRPA